MKNGKILRNEASLFYHSNAVWIGLGWAGTGIRFAEGSWKELLETAKKEGKLIFVDCYTEWCQPCKQMEQQVFPSKKWGSFTMSIL